MNLRHLPNDFHFPVGIGFQRFIRRPDPAGRHRHNAKYELDSHIRIYCKDADSLITSLPLAKVTKRSPTFVTFITSTASSQRIGLETIIATLRHRSPRHRQSSIKSL